MENGKPTNRVPAMRGPVLLPHATARLSGSTRTAGSKSHDLALLWPTVLRAWICENACLLAPKGPKHISPGQGNASIASVAVALGTDSDRSVALKGRNR